MPHDHLALSQQHEVHTLCHSLSGGWLHKLSGLCRKDWAGWVGASGPCRTLWPTEEAPPALAQSNSPLPQEKICQIPNATSDEIKQGSRVLMPSADEELQVYKLP